MDEKHNWILAATKALQDAGSWTGRIHIQKLLFLMKEFGLGDPPFRFEIYHYGPYASTLDQTIAEMEMDGLLEKQYRQPGYGASYSPVEDCCSKGPTRNLYELVTPLANKLGDKRSKDLELIATCVWVEKVEKERDAGKIVARVKKLKPKYTDQQIESSLQDARRIESQVARAN